MGSAGVSSGASSPRSTGGEGAVRAEGTHASGPRSATGDPAWGSCSGAGGAGTACPTGDGRGNQARRDHLSPPVARIIT